MLITLALRVTCLLTSDDFTASGAGTDGSYSWDNSLGSAANQVVSSAGTYTVTVTGSNGCTDQASIAITVNNILLLQLQVMTSLKIVHKIQLVEQLVLLDQVATPTLGIMVLELVQLQMLTQQLLLHIHLRLRTTLMDVLLLTMI